MADISRRSTPPAPERCSTQANYEITAKLGRGKYSEVFAGYNVTDAGHVVIKILKVRQHTRLRLPWHCQPAVRGAPRAASTPAAMQVAADQRLGFAAHSR